MTFEVKQADQKFPYVITDNKVSHEEITQLAEQYNMELLSIKTLDSGKIRYGFKKREEE